MTGEQTPNPSMPPVDSLKKRSIFKMLSNVVGLFTNVFTQAIVPRALGPGAFGNFNFLSDFFGQATELIDGYSSTGALVKISLRPSEHRLTSFYLLYVLAASLFILVLVSLVQFLGLGDWIWPDQERRFVFLATVWALFRWWQIVLQMICDAHGLTVAAEKIKIAQRLSGVLLIGGLFVLGQLSLVNYFFYYIFILLFLVVGFLVILIASGRFPPLSEFFLASHEFRTYAKEYFSYSLPLFSFIAAEAVLGVWDRWLLQKYSGSVEQGYFGFAYQIGYISILFVGAMSPLIGREFAVAFANRNLVQSAYLFRRTMPLLFGTAAFFSAFSFDRSLWGSPL
jgi:O-antigen/teichoic acid export membrane protein